MKKTTEVAELIAVALLFSSTKISFASASQEWGRKTTVTKESFASPPNMKVAEGEEVRVIKRKRIASNVIQIDYIENDKLDKDGMHDSEAFGRDLMVHYTQGWGKRLLLDQHDFDNIERILRDVDFPTISMSFPTSMPSPQPSTSSVPTTSLAPTVTAAPTITPEPTITPAPTISAKPTVTAAPTVTSAPTVSAAPTVTSAPTVTAVPTVTSAPTTSFSPTISSAPTPINCTDPTTRERLIMEELISISGEEAFEDENSPQSKSANWIINDDELGINPCTFVGLGQRYGLGVFYFGLNGDDWNQNTGWLGGTSVCDGWYQVTCDGKGLVREMLFSNNNLAGELEPEIKELTGLQLIQLLGNNVSGNIPTEIGLLQNLFGIDFESNDFKGKLFFDELFGLTNLTFFRASMNQFTGVIPWDEVVTSFPNLQEFWIASNRFTGEIDTQIGELQNLVSFFAYKNSLTGPIPSEIGAISTLRRLDLEDNFLGEEIPDELYGISGLRQIILSNNNLSGSISSLIGDLSQLTNLWLSNNQLTGVLPVEITGASNLETLLLDGNDLVGEIPFDVGNLQKLDFINLSNNTFNGTIPPSFFFLPNLEILYLENNKLSGPIPPEIANANELRDLYLSGNLLNGTIPEVPTGALSALQEILLSFNDLSGSVPSSICALRDNAVPPGKLISLHVDCAIPPDPPEVECAADCCTKCTRG